MNEQKLVYSKWSNDIYPCAENCGFVGNVDEYFLRAYDLCPKCGASRGGFGSIGARTGRFVYELVPHPWVPFLKTKKFLRIEWRKPEKHA
jgi:hypothetical protein